MLKQKQNISRTIWHWWQEPQQFTKR